MKNFISAAVLFFALIFSYALSARTYYVNTNYTGSTENGLSWATPFKKLESALAAAASGDDIWIAKGTYTAPNVAYAYNVKVTMNIYGGFAGNETSIYERDLVLNKTILQTINNTLIFSVKQNSELHLDGIELTNFSAAIYLQQDTTTNNYEYKPTDFYRLFVNNCKFYNAGLPIGCPYGAEVTVQNTTFFNISSPLVTSGGNDPNYQVTDYSYTSVKFDNIQVDQNNSVAVSLSNVKLEVSNSSFKGYNAPVFTGDFYSTSIQSSVFTGCNCQLISGNIQDSNIFIDGCTFQDFMVNCGFTAGPPNSNLKMSNSSIKNVTSNTYFFNQGNIDLENVELKNITVNTNFFVPQGKVWMNKCTIDGVIASSGTTQFLSSSSDLDIRNSTFKNNAIQLFYQNNSVSKSVFNNCIFDNNTGQLSVASYYPDMLSLTSQDISIENCRFINNNYTNTPAYTGNYGLLSVGGNPKFKLTNTTFKNNKTVYFSAGLYISASVLEAEITDCIFDGNSTTNADNNNAGAVFINTASNKPIQIRNTTFQNNSASYYGAAYIAGTTISFENSLFLQNKSTLVSNGSNISCGGALGINSNPSSTTAALFKSCSFIGNETQRDAGAVYINYYMINVKMQECIFKLNKSVTGSSAIIDVNANLSIYNSLFDGNTTTGTYGSSGLYSTYAVIAHQLNVPYDQPLNIYGCTFVNNRSVNGHSVLGGVRATSINNSIFWNNGTNQPINTTGSSYPIIRNCNIQGGGYTGTNVYDVNPQFEDAAGGNYRLSCQSTLINKGNNTYASGFDLDGKARIYADTVDLGAYEKQIDPSIINAAITPLFTIPVTVCKDEVATIINNTANPANYTYRWDFGNGQTSTLAAPAFSYVQPGTYSIQLTASNMCGQSNSITKQITVRATNAPTISTASVVCPGDESVYTTNAACSSLAWTVTGGTITSGQGTTSIHVVWGNGTAGNGKVTLLATGCGTSACEIPVSIEIPITPVNFTLTGNTKVCQGSIAHYATVNKDKSPATMYTWSAKNGNVYGTNAGYNLTDVDVQWSTTALQGVVYLTTYNEFLKCGRSDSFIVALRPTFHIGGAMEACGNLVTYYQVNPLIAVTWTVAGAGNTIDATGKATWSNTDGNYKITAVPQNSDDACNAIDSFFVHVNTTPVVTGITGETEISLNSVDTYTAQTSINANNLNFFWSTPGGTVLSTYANTATIKRNNFLPDNISVFVKTKIGNCASDPVSLPVTEQFVYTITGPASICIGESATYTANTNPSSAATYTWKSTLSGSSYTGNPFDVVFTNPGTQQILLTVTSNGKTFSVIKNVTVNSSPSKISIEGPAVIDPDGLQTATYTIKTPANAAYAYNVTGGVIQNKTGDVLTVKWGGTAPFEITVNDYFGANTCTGVPVRFVVTTAQELSKVFSASKPACLNSSVLYTFAIDEFTKGVSWTLNGGGNVVLTNNNTVTIEWTQTGSHTLTVNYDRFGPQTLSLPIVVNALPQPQISSGTICGTNGFTLSTTQSYVSYEWYLNDATTSFSTLAKPQIIKEGMYIVQVTDNNGCVNSGNQYIKQIPLPKANIFSYDNLSVCYDAASSAQTNIHLSTFEGQYYNYQWFVDNVAIPGNNSFTLPVTQPLNQQKIYSYKVKVTLETCEQTSDVAYVSVNACGGGGVGSGCQEPQVSFVVDPASCQPLTFTNTSTSTDEFGWSFGDGTYSTKKNPDPKTYTTAGLFNVQLTRRCQGSGTIIEVPAVALFKLDQPGCKGQSLLFKDLSVNIPLRKIAEWKWNFGDGTETTITSGARDQYHAFADTGKYTVTLTIKVPNSQGVLCDYTYSQIYHITAPPITDFTVTPPPCTGSIYTFIDKSIVTYGRGNNTWTFSNSQTSYRDTTLQQFPVGNQSAQLKVTDLLGCTSTKTTTITVTAPYQIGVITKTSADTLLCNGRTVTLTAPVSAAGYQWKKDGTTIFGATAQTYNVTLAGNYSVTYSPASGCTATTQNHRVNSYAVPNLVSGEKLNCVGGSITIKTNLSPSEYSYKWLHNTDTLAANATDLVIYNITPAEAGNYTPVVIQRATGCYTALPAYAITVNQNPSKPDIVADLLNVCFKGTTNIHTTATKAGKTFSWYQNSVVLTSADTVITTNPLLTDATFVVKVKDNSTGCSTLSDNLVIRVAPAISVVLTGDTVVCQQASAELKSTLSTNNFDFQWYKNGVAYGSNNARLSFSSIQPADSGSYTLRATSNGSVNMLGCSALSNTKTVKVKAAAATPVITGAAEFCAGSATTLTTNLSSDFIWNTGATTPSITVSSGGSYFVTSTNPVSGCTIKTTQLVTQNPLPDLSFIPSGEYERCGTNKIAFEGLNAYPITKWYIGGQLFNTNKIVYPTQSGKYTVTVSTAKGCTSISDTMIINTQECACYVTNTNDSGDGSLREAINCSNDKPGKDAIKFNIIGTGPFVIKPLTALPVIKDSVFINGFSQSGNGIYDIVLDGSGTISQALYLQENLANVTISGLTINNFNTAIVLSSGTNNNTVEKNIISTTGTKFANIIVSDKASNNFIYNNQFNGGSSGVEFAAKAKNNIVESNTIMNAVNGIEFKGGTHNTIQLNAISGSAGNGIILQNAPGNNILSNTIGTSANSGIVVQLGSDSTKISSNYIGVDAAKVIHANQKNGVSVVTNVRNTIINSNTIAGNGLNGLLIKGQQTTIQNNFIGTNSSGVVFSNNGYGIYAMADSAIVTGNTISNNNNYGVLVKKSATVTNNTIVNNASGGVYAEEVFNTFSKNVITNIDGAVKAIDLHAGTTPPGNANKQPAVFKSYRRAGSGGILIKGTSVAGDTVEIFYNNNVAQQALSFAGSTLTDAAGNWEIEIPQGTAFNPNAKNYYVNTARSSVNNTSELSTPYLTGCFTCICKVTNTNDSGTGSLRAVIDSANAGGCMTINFEMTSPDTIRLASALNPILAPVIIAGPYSTDPDPMIFIKGSTTFNGLVVNNDGAQIIDLGFTNFKQAVVVNSDYNIVRDVTITNSIRPLTITGNNSQVFSSAINTTWANDLSTFRADTLVYITGKGNQIGGTGVDNKITNGATGVLVDGGTSNSILNNAIYNNTKAISLINNGNTNYDKPASIVGSITGSTAIIQGTAKPNDKIQIFSSTYVPEQANGFVIEVTADANGNWTATIPPANIDLTQNNYFVATSTSTTGNTSQLSPPIRVGNFVQVCYVTNTNDSGDGSLREAVNCANTAGLGTNGLPARIEFQLPSAPNVISLASGLVITNNYGVEVNARNTPVSVKTTNPALNAFTWSTNNFKVKNLTFENFSNALYCTGLNALIDSNNFVNNKNAIYVNAADSIVQQTITNNYFTGGTSSINSAKGSLLVNNNSFGISKAGVDGPIAGYGISATHARSVVIINNTFENISKNTATVPAAANGYAISVENAVSSISSNTITGNVSTALAAIRLYANKNTVVSANTINTSTEGILFDRCDSAVVYQNALSNISARGININKSSKIRLSQNTITGLTADKPIDLNLATPNVSNNSKTAPVILTSTYHDGKLFLIGQSEKFDEVEVFYSDNNKLNLVKYIEKSTADSTGTWIVSFPISAQGSDTLFFRAVATKTNNLSSQASAAFTPKLKICLVTTDADLGVGSLREAIDKANMNQCNLIQFAIPGSGVAEIRTASELPAITAPLLIIDGTSQNGYRTGSPTVDLINNAANGFNGQNGNQLDIYGMKITNFDVAINILNSKIINTSDNIIQNATDTGIKIKTSGFMYGNIENNTIAAQVPLSTGISVDGTSKMEITQNRISDFSDVGISVIGNNQKLVNNTIRSSNSTTSVGIAVNNSSSIYMQGDTIVQAKVGFQISNGNANEILLNVIGKTDSVSKARNYIVKETGVSITASNNCFVSTNTINVTKNAVTVTNAKGYLINTNTIRKGETSILLSNAPNGNVNNNTIDSALVGIQVDASHGVSIYNNLITRAVNYGVILNAGSDTCKLTANLIGARYLGDPTYAEGTGVLVKSSNNYIGPDSDLGLGNYIKQNKKGGVIVDGGTKNSIRYNFFYNNDITKGRPTAYAIQLINSGNNTKAKPTITSHKWIGDTLHVYGTNNNAAGDSIHLYLGTGGYEEASKYLGRINSKAGGTWEIKVDTAISKHIPPRTTWYLVATATDVNRNTSPLSDMYILGDCYITSLKDTTDNQYPLPNTMRMAMKCANGQANPVGVYFNVAQGGAKEVKLQMKMQDLNNKYGVYFNGKNIPDGVIAGMDAQKAAGTSWTIAATNAKSSITNFQILNASDGLQVLSDSILVQKIRFDRITGTGLLVNNKKIVVDSCVFDSLSIGIKPAVNAVGSVFSGNTFNGTNQGILAANMDSLSIRTNTFNNGVATGIDIDGSTHTDISGNRFNSNQTLAKSIVWNNSKGSVLGNTFTAHFSDNPVSISNTTQIDIANNIFKDSANVYLMLSDVSRANITNNMFVVATQNSIKTSNVTYSTIMNNVVNQARNDAFNLEGSSNVFVSKNIVNNVRYTSKADSALCINIHKGEGSTESNLGKEEPKNLSYQVKNGPDRRKGIFVQGTAQAGDSIEIFFSDSISASMNKYIVNAFAEADSNGRWEVKIPREFYYQDTVTWYHVIAVAIDKDSNTSKTSSVLHIPPSTTKIYVRNVFNAGPNSLRQALLDVTYSDLYSKVIFSIDFPTKRPGPYNIVIDSLLDPVNSYLGFEMDGATQKVFAPVIGDQRIIVNGKKIGNQFGLDIIDSSKECLLKNIWMNNAKNGLRISNNKNQIEKFYFVNTDSTVVAQLDTAFVIQSEENKIKNIGISDYKLGVLFQNQVGKNQFTESTIDSTNIGIALKDSSYQNFIAKVIFTNTTEHGVLIDSAAADNKINNNIFGKENQAIQGNAIAIKNSSNQTLTYNRISYMDENIALASISTAIQIEGKSTSNFVYSNRIGLDSLGASVHTANIRGMSILRTADGTPTENSLVGNEINGTQRTPIYVSGAAQDLISENIIGGDSSKNVYGVDSTAIYVINSTNEQLNDNIILGYKMYGIELLSSTTVQMHRNTIYSKATINKAINIHALDATYSNNKIAVPTITDGILTDISTIKLTGTAIPNSQVEVYQSVKDTSQAIAYVDKVFASSNGNGDWELLVPKIFFSYATQNTFTAQNHANSSSSELSAPFTPSPVLCQLQNNTSIKVLEPKYTPCPGPDFNLDPPLDEQLHFAWKAPDWLDSVRTKKLPLADTTENLVLTVKDDFGCTLTRTTDVIFKAKPISPNFIVSSEVFTRDTIVLVDVSFPVPDSYTWYSSPGVTVLRSSATAKDSLIGEDGNVYPKGVRFIEFILPDSNTYTIRQTSLRDGCFVEQSKQIHAKNKNVNDPNPYFVAPKVQSMYTYPNPSAAGDDVFVNITVSSKDKITLTLFSMLGTEIGTAELSGKTNYNVKLLGTGSTQLFTNNLSSGVYILKLKTSDDEELVFKVVVGM